MPQSRKYAIIFSSDMQHPIYIVADNFEDFLYRLRDIMQKFGEIEFIYRVY